MPAVGEEVLVIRGCNVLQSLLLFVCKVANVKAKAEHH